MQNKNLHELQITGNIIKKNKMGTANGKFRVKDRFIQDFGGET